MILRPVLKTLFPASCSYWMQLLCSSQEKRGGHVTGVVRDKVLGCDYWTLYILSGHISSSVRTPGGFGTSNTAGQVFRRRRGQWYLQVPIQTGEIPLGPHWQIVLVWPHERARAAVIAYFPLIAFVTRGVRWRRGAGVWRRPQRCAKPNSRTLTCTARTGRARAGPAINYAAAANISRATTEAAARWRNAAGPLGARMWSWRRWLDGAV